jgi:cell division protein FtsZ
MGIGSSRGDDRAIAAAELAISSPLLEASIDGAQGVLLSIAGGSDLGLFEINEAAQLVTDAAHPDANIIFGAVIDDALGDEVRVTVIAAGFDGGLPRIKREPVRRAIEEPVEEILDLTETPARTAPPPAPTPTYVEDRPERAEPAARREPARAARPPRTIVFDDADDLDVPDFLK